MCIAVSKGAKAPESGVGWKVFILNGKRLRFQFFSRHLVHRGRWLKAVHHKIVDDFSNTYTSGFHVYMRKPPDSWFGKFSPELVQVKFRKGHTVGWQDDEPVVVADELLIPLKKKR